MTDKDLAIEKVQNFLKDKNKRILLLKGYDNEAKLKVALICLNEIFKKGIIRTSSMKDISDHINHAFNRKVLNHSVVSTKSYNLGNMVVNINSYASSTVHNHSSDKEKFTLYYPVQTVLDNPQRFKGFLSDIEKCNSKKIILITTNEWSINNWDIENHVDETFFYSVENDNPQLMKNLKNNKAI